MRNQKRGALMGAATAQRLCTRTWQRWKYAAEVVAAVREAKHVADEVIWLEKQSFITSLTRSFS